jgi:hypothetical protein
LPPPAYAEANFRIASEFTSGILLEPVAFASCNSEVSFSTWSARVFKAIRSCGVATSAFAALPPPTPPTMSPPLRIVPTLDLVWPLLLRPSFPALAVLVGGVFTVAAVEVAVEKTFCDGEAWLVFSAEEEEEELPWSLLKPAVILRSRSLILEGRKEAWAIKEGRKKGRKGRKGAEWKEGEGRKKAK